MEAAHKRILRPLSLALRHELEGWRDENGGWHPGDLERRLAELGIHREKSKPLDEMPHLSGDDRRARVVVDGYLQLRADAGIERDDAVAEFVRESAYTWANRLFALRCMEARSIIEEVILQKTAYAGRSLLHQRFLRKAPDAAAGADDGLFAVLFAEFAARAAELPALFDPHAAAVALRPSVAALKRCVALLSGTESVRGQEPATDEVFSAPDAFGWAYQYWNTEEKDRVFEAVRPPKRKKIEGADIVPATQLYTEPYMVKFLVQNSLGALWMSLHPESRLCDDWEYYVRDADRAPIEVPPGGRSVRDFTFLDPALGSGHFHVEAFDLFFAMYREENPALTPREIAASILNRNLFGIELDERAVQIAEAALWMKAKAAAQDLEATDLDTFHDHLVATNIRLPRGRDHLEAFLRRHPEDAPLRPALELVFRGLGHADELGSLLQIEEPMDRELRRLKEEADTTGITPPVQPDMFRATAVQSALPIGVESYEAWKTGALDRLKAHFEQEAEAADSARAFFGASARKGLALFDLLAQRYDVVAANPPYLGFRKMGGPAHTILKQRYQKSCYDLYAVFIERNIQLARTGGFVAMVTMHSYMFVPSLAELRKSMVEDHEIEVLAHVGAGAFEELGDHAPAVLTILQQGRLRENAQRNIAVIPHSTAEDKPRILREKWNLKRIPQSQFASIEGYTFAYTLSPSLLALFTDFPPLGRAINYRNGMFTTNNPRFLRFHWETPTDRKRWIPYYKVPFSARWYVPTDFVIDWNNDGDRLKTYSLTKHSTYTFNIVNERHFFDSGVVLKATGSMGPCAKVLESGQICDIESTGIFDMPDAAASLVLLHNSRLALYLLHELNPTPHFYISDLERLPTLTADASIRVELDQLLAGLVAEMKALWGDALTSRDFSLRTNASTNIRGQFVATELRRLSSGVRLTLMDSVAEKIFRDSFAICPKDAAHIEAIAGKPEATFPVIQCPSDTALEFQTTLLEPKLVAHLAAESTTVEFSTAELADVRRKVRAFYSKDSPEISEEDAGPLADDDEESEREGTTVRLPCETPLLKLSRELGFNPASIAALIATDLASNALRLPTAETAFSQDRFSVLVLRMLGHRWPKQIDAGEPLRDWADRDGVIPLSIGSSEPTLAERVVERLSEEFPGSDLAAIRAEFDEMVGMPLDAWLASAFFARHIPQFKKRPIAWQLQSVPAAQPGRRRSSPAAKPVFACLVYYPRLDADLLPKLRSHYLAVLRTAHETELRTLEGLSQPTPDQGARKAELEVLVDELDRFDAQLQAVVETGFGPAPLQPRLRQLAVDDAMLAMKTRWLARLRDTLQAAPLAEWQKSATALGHHAEFPSWIAAAIARLPLHCFKAGAKSPDAAKLPEDPTPTTLAAVICAETDAMTVTALDFACAEWMHEWDAHVIQPLRARIAAANNALEALAAELETLDRRNTARVENIAREQKRLRAEVKTLKAEIKTKTEKAGQLAASIRKWTSPELPTWESWLASGPLFDEVSTLDGQRAAPVTIHDFIQQESLYAPDLNDGVRVNIAPLQRAGLLPSGVIAGKDVDKAIADRAEWRADERRWVREGKMPHPGWWTAIASEGQP